MFSKTTLSALALALVKLAAAESYLLTFGDSYSQTGFDINGQRPSESNPLGNPAFPGWTSSGGANWIGNLISVHNSGPVLSYNFAEGGAVVNKDIVTDAGRDPRSFVQQVQVFADSIASFGPWDRDNTVAGVWFGVNDIGITFGYPDSRDYNARIVASYFEQLQILYNFGVRHFALLGAPPTERTPLMLQQSAGEPLRSALLDFNDKIKAGIETFVATNTEADIKFVDTQPVFFQVIEHWGDYGAPDATCNNGDGGSTCLWQDSYHPATEIQKAVAAKVAQDVGFIFN